MEHTKKISRKTKREHKTLTGWLFIAPAFICYSRFPRAVLSAVPHVYSGVFHGVEMADESAGRVAQHAAFSCWASHLRLAQ